MSGKTLAQIAEDARKEVIAAQKVEQTPAPFKGANAYRR